MKNNLIILITALLLLSGSCKNADLNVATGYNVSYEITFDRGVLVEYIQFTNEQGNIVTLRNPDSGFKRVMSIPSGRNVIGTIKGAIKAGAAGKASVTIKAKNTTNEFNSVKPFSMTSDTTFQFFLSDTITL
jgi:hypothetical protein